MPKVLKFTLPAGLHTWAVRRDDPRVLISGHIVDGAQLPYDEVHDAEGYVARGQAVVVEVEPVAVATEEAAAEESSAAPSRRR